MRSFVAVLFLIGLALTAGPSAQGTIVAFEGVTVIPMDRERVLSNQTAPRAARF